MNSSEELFQEIDFHLSQDEIPSDFINTLIDNPLFREYPFDMIYRLKSVEQSPTHHPEGNVWNHSMLVVDEAAKLRNESKDSRALMWAALLHDIGKYPTSKKRKGKITSYDHDKVGAKLAREFLKEFTDDDEFITKVAALVRWHMQILFVAKDLPFANIKEMKEETDINEIALLGKCDRFGRLNVDVQKENKAINLFLQKCNAIYNN